MSIKDICRNHLITVDKGESLQKAAQIMKDNNIGSLVVTDKSKNDYKPYGILTDRDIVTKVFAEEIDFKEVKVSDVMSTNLLVSDQDDEINEVIKNMYARTVRRTLVVDSSGKAVGIVSMDDLIFLISRELRDLSALIKKQVDSPVK